jgi:hypothetical protein
VTGVVAAVELHNVVNPPAQQICRFALAFVAPLGADQHDRWHPGLLIVKVVIVKVIAPLLSRRCSSRRCSSRRCHHVAVVTPLSSRRLFITPLSSRRLFITPLSSLSLSSRHRAQHLSSFALHPQRL